MTLVVIFGPPAVGKMTVGCEYVRLGARRSRNVERSRANLLHADQTYQMNSRGSFFYPERHLKIESTALEPGEVARRIATHFALVPVSAG